jgi:glycerol-3-phosphate dehydrogenase (NAD(P)+)
LRAAVIGAGSWGTTLAAVLAEKLDEVIIWTRRQETAEEINIKKTNSAYLPGTILPENLSATSDIEEAVKDRDLIIIAVPARYFRGVVEKLKNRIPARAFFLSVTKGIEQNTTKRMSEIISEVLEVPEEKIAVLSGPNHAEEVIKRIPTATVIASSNLALAERIQKLFMRSYFRVYTHDDVVGVELAAATKNVIAIAVGISDGLGYGDNTRATLITRGLAEMLRLGIAFGASPLTYLGLSGIGDLVATATSRHSRNRNFGEQVSKGGNIEDILKSSRMVVEGVNSSKSVLELAQKKGIEMPITLEVYRIIYEGRKPIESVNSLMEREPKPEIDLKIQGI